MRLHLVRDATAEEVASTPPTSSDWSAFLSTFKEAVRRRDFGLLFRIRARSFSDANSYAYSQPQTPAEELARIKLNGVERALAEGMESSGNTPLGRAQRVIVEKHNRLYVEYNRASKVRFTFIQDRDNKWRWSYIDYPSE